MTNEEILKELLSNNYSDKIVRIRAKYEGTDEGFNERLLDIYNKLKDDFLFKYYERLNNLYMMQDEAEFEKDKNAIDKLEGQIQLHEKTRNEPFLLKLKKEIEDYINDLETIPLKKEEEPKYKTQNLFKVGLLFANGQMNKYFKIGKDDKIIPNDNYSAPDIAKEFNNSVNHEYIKASLRNYKDNHDIFNSYNMMTNVINHCKTENIPIEPFFMRKYSSIEHF